MNDTKNKQLKIVTITAVIFLVMGISLYIYSTFMIQNLEQLMANGNLTSEELNSYNGSFQWWNRLHLTVFFPVTVGLVTLGTIFLGLILIIIKQNVVKSKVIISKSSLKKSTSANMIDKIIVKTINEKNPETVEHLFKLVQKETRLSEKTILDKILSLQQERKIKLKMPSNIVPHSFSFFVSGASKWYWATLVFTALSLFFIFQSPVNAFPLIYGRYILGSFFVLVVPGYALMKALHPGKEIDIIERIGLSICMSIALACVISFLLNFSPWGIVFSYLVWILSGLIIIFASVGIIREFFQLKKTLIKSA